MKRILLVLAVALVMSSVAAVMVVPAFAGPRGENHCNHKASPLCGGHSPGGNPLHHHP
jgi:multidrug efflux pump subunit AcrB